MFQKYVFDVALTQISQNTDLHIGYELVKKGRSFESIRFQIKQQEPQQLPLPFEQPLGDSRLQMARQLLAELDIRDVRLVEQILAEARRIDELFYFCYKLKTGKMKASTNPGGLFLTVVELRKFQPVASKK
jgi:plasmid replication initiation protein